MNVNSEPYLIEYNCRLGDPETEVVLPRLQNDLLTLLIANNIFQLDDLEIVFDERAVATIMAVSGGYPEAYHKGDVITGLPQKQPADADVLIFHAGTKIADEKVVTNGGRVLTATAYGQTIQDAVAKSKKALEDIKFNGMNFRKDIGYEFKN